VVNQEIEDSLASFRKKFGMILADMKFLVDDEAARKKIESATKSLEDKIHDPVIEEEVSKDLQELQEICAPINPNSHRPSSLDRD